MKKGNMYIVDYLDHCSYQELSKPYPATNHLVGYYVKSGVINNRRYYIFSMDWDKESNEPLHPYTSILSFAVLKIKEMKNGGN